MARFGFASMLRLNLAQSLARRGITVAIEVPAVERGIAEATPKSEPSGDAPTFAALVRRHRLEAGLSQEALAERARISVNGLSALERGTRRTPQRETLALLMEALALSDADRARFELASGRAIAAAPQSAVRDTPSESARAECMIVVATPAWYADEACRAQLALFESGGGDRPAIERSFVVRRDPFEAEVEILKGRSRFDFFRDAHHARPFEPLYRNDGTPAPAFYDVVDSIAQTLHRQMVAGGRTSSSDLDARAIYVAPPSSDMEAPYRTLVAELEGSGYLVLPSGVASGSDALGFDHLDSDLASSVMSIHLLGDVDEFDDAGRSRVSFPLARAADRAAATGGVFRRVLFAPKMLPGARDVASIERDPIEIRDRFAGPLASDTIIGDGLTDFVLAVKDIVKAAAQRSQRSTEPAELAPKSSVFLNFHPGDVLYARGIAKALRERGLRARFAAFEDDKIQNRITNAELVRDSQAIVHCWADATDAWLYAEAANYEDWRKFGRSLPFATRAAIAGPPERGSKMLYTAEDPPESIDVYVDLTARDAPLASDLDPIVAMFRPKA